MACGRVSDLLLAGSRALGYSMGHCHGNSMSAGTLGIIMNASGWWAPVSHLKKT